MKRSLRFKVTVSFLGAVMLLIFLIVTFSVIFLRPILIRDSAETIQNYGELISDVYVGGSDTVRKTMTMIDSSHDIQTVILSEDMEVVDAYTEIYPNSMKLTLVKSWLEDYLAAPETDEPYCIEIKDKTDDLNRIIYICPIPTGEYLVMSKVIKGIDQVVDIALLIIAAESILVGIIGVIMCIILTRPYITQMEKMSRITRKMALLEFDEKIGYKSNDEVGVLASSIDDMSDKLRMSIERLQMDVDRRKRLIRDISHELKTPVTTIRGYTENIQIMTQDNPRIQRYCGIMVEECEVIDELVSEMLYMSKLESDGYSCEEELLDFTLLEARLKQRIENECAEGQVTIDFDGTDVYANQVLTERAVLNYILNAVKHCTPDTHITVRGYAKGKSFIFSVENFGEELSEKDRELIWDVFYKIDKARTRSDKGHGIGLAIVRQIATLHKGKTYVESGNGKNTFYLELPLK